MIAVGQINVPQDEVEYSNKDMKLRINNSGYERGELIITKRQVKRFLAGCHAKFNYYDFILVRLHGRRMTQIQKDSPFRGIK